MRTITAQQMKEIDAIAIQERGIPSVFLMERAARAVADEALSLLQGRNEARVAVLCGPGNNGGDGMAAARFLLQEGVQARVFLAGDPDKMTPDTAEMSRRLKECGGSWEPLREDDAWFSRCDLLIDAVIGIGLRAAVRGAAAQAVSLLERYGDGKAIAVDIASGIDADTGANLGNNCRYAKTVTFTLPKPGHFVGHGGLTCGELVVCNIGIPADLAALAPSPVTAVDADLVRAILPKRDPAGHKGTFGQVHILGGSVGYTGAPVLAAKAALRTGSGLISLSVPAPIYPIVAAKCDEVMPAPLPCEADGSLSKEALSCVQQALHGKDACLIGPGLGRSEAAQALVCDLLRTAQLPVVLDADGLNALSLHMQLLSGRNHPTILTPHDGEFARLGGELKSQDRLGAALTFAKTHGCILVLKGPGTITALPNGRAYVNTTGNSGMAKGGSGDVLSGMILSLVGQGLSVEKAAVAAVWLHGRAGDLAAADKGEYGMTPGDLIEQIPHAILEVMRAPATHNGQGQPLK